MAGLPALSRFVMRREVKDETSRILLNFSEENPPQSWWKLAVDNVDYLAGVLALRLQVSNALGSRNLGLG